MTMPKVSLTYFVDFVLKAGTPKLTVVRTFKKRGDYDPRTDFYKRFRDKFVDTLSSGGSVSSMLPWAEGVHEKKRAAYKKAARGAEKYLGRSPVNWFAPPRTDYQLGPTVLTVNPEVGVIRNGRRYAIKLYFKEDKLVKNRADVILHLMKSSLGAAHKNLSFGVLDMRAGRCHTKAPTQASMHALLLGEAASFAAMFGGA